MYFDFKPKGFFIALIILIIGVLGIFGMLYPVTHNLVEGPAAGALTGLTFIPILITLFGLLGIFISTTKTN